MKDRDYQHKTVNHDLHFVDPTTLAHTNSIESVWNSAKIHLKAMRGVSRRYLNSYLDEFLWRRNTCKSRFEAVDKILTAIAEQYPPCDDLISCDSLTESVDDIIDNLLDSETIEGD